MTVRTGNISSFHSDSSFGNHAFQRELVSTIIRVPNSEFGFEIQDLSDLRNFLRLQREKLQGAMNLQPEAMPEVHVVMGNESGDLDSIISSIVRAFHLSLTARDNSLYLPYINIHREELQLHNDALYLLENYGISADNLSFIDDRISLEAIHQRGKLRLHLVDHNELTPDQGHLNGTVVDILDHHADAKKYLDLQQKVICQIGSCTTLVALELLKVMPIEMMPKALAGMLLAPVLMDTDNLTCREKTTAKDVDMAKTLSTKAATLLPADYYEIIKAKKKDTSNIPSSLLLVRDFKKFKADDVIYGMSSLTASQGFWIDDEASLLHELEAVSRKRCIDFLVVLMPYRDAGRKQRRILVYSKSCEVLAALNEFIRNDEYLRTMLVLARPSENKSDTISFYISQEFVSRKVLQPKIHEISTYENFTRALKSQNK